MKPFMNLVKALALGVGATILTSCTGFEPGRSDAPPATAMPTWGTLPIPLFHPDYGAVPAWSSAPQPPLYAGPVNLVWNGAPDEPITQAPVFRYAEPSFAQANRFAAALQATPEGDTTATGRSWSYGNNREDFRIVVVHTVDAHGTSPTYLIFPAPDTPVAAASAGPLSRAVSFLGAHGLLPDWPYTVVMQTGASQSAAGFEHSFQVPGYGPAYFVDQNGARGGLLVSFDSDRLLEVAGMFPLTLRAHDYGILSPDAAYSAAYGAPRSVPPGSPTVELTHVELAYIVVPAGNFGFYEPAYLFSGSLQIQGIAYTKLILAAAIDPRRNA
jgi:hypothetical protein